METSLGYYQRKRRELKPSVQRHRNTRTPLRSESCIRRELKPSVQRHRNTRTLLRSESCLQRTQPSVQRHRSTRTPLRLESCIRRELMTYPRHRVSRLVGERRVEHLHPRDQGCRQVQLRESAERLKLQINRNSRPAWFSAWRHARNY